MENKIREQLLSLCKKAYENAYAPYSNFAVGAALVTKDQKAFLGANIENAAFGSTMCAERVCIFSAYANGVRKEDIEAIGIISNSKDLAMPCGACRQVLSELLDEYTTIYIFNLDGDCIETDIATLLPYAFNANNLSNV